MRPLAITLAITLALGACAGGQRWSKAGVTADTAASDVADCRSLAYQATRRDSQIDSDILASRGHDWSNSGTLGVHQAVNSASTSERADEMVQSCMQAKGYAPTD
ncbi:MAG TPA: hypothetical protein VN802_09580 [Stellaceae bacterium]|nr:hypothetical protein [Stellaceae bacterium]